MRIEGYALIGDTQTAALVGRNGLIDWLCLRASTPPLVLPHFLGIGWRVSPDAEVRRSRRHYRQFTLILESLFLRFYGHEFDVESREKILPAIESTRHPVTR